jgi:hypothetical protein
MGFLREMPIDQDGGTGFDVDPAQLTGIAGRMGKVYDDYDTALADFESAPCVADGVYGDSGVAQAADSCFSAWAQELSFTLSALQEMVEKVSTSAQLYQETESAITGNLRRVTAA